MHTRPFTIEVPQAELDDLQARLRNTRWPNELQPEGWTYGTELAYLRRLADYWANGFDWRAAEARLNAVPHHLAEVQGLELHYIHARGEGDGTSVPVVLLHGWADSFHRYSKLTPLLTAAGFDVVVPSLPGFDFSTQPPAGRTSAAFAADSVAELMAGLGYDRYLVHGGDWGAAVAQELGRSHADHVTGLHLTDVPFPNFFMVDRAELADDERAFLEAVDTWGETEAGYVGIQSTRPLTLAYGLSDSPVGLAGWLIEHFHRYADTMFDDDDLIVNTMLYWVRNTIRSSIRYYSEGMGGDWGDDAGAWGEPSGTDASGTAWGEGPTDATTDDSTAGDAAAASDPAAAGATTPTGTRRSRCRRPS